MLNKSWRLLGALAVFLSAPVAFGKGKATPKTTNTAETQANNADKDAKSGKKDKKSQAGAETPAPASTTPTEGPAAGGGW